MSGSVSLELLYRGKPSAILYRHRWISIALAHLLKNVRYITLVNLLADKELFPEYFGRGCPAETLAGHVLGWLNDRSAYELAVRRVGRFARARGAPARGACGRGSARDGASEGNAFKGCVILRFIVSRETSTSQLSRQRLSMRSRHSFCAGHSLSHRCAPLSDN